MCIKCIVFHRGVSVAGRLVGLHCRKLSQLEEERRSVCHGGESKPRGIAVIVCRGAHCIIFFQRECSGNVSRGSVAREWVSGKGVAVRLVTYVALHCYDFSSRKGFL